MNVVLSLDENTKAFIDRAIWLAGLVAIIVIVSTFIFRRF